MNDGTVSLQIKGQELLLHPERAVVWSGLKTVIVADTHFGKSSYFARHGIGVPSGTDEADRARLNRLVRDYAAERLIILGDFLHAPINADSREVFELTAWARELAPTHIVVVAGNHDRDRGPPQQWSSSISWREGAWLQGPFCFVHDADRHQIEADHLFTLSGHIHPVMRLQDLRKASLRVPVFWQRSTGLVLPSFGQFTGGFAVQSGVADHLFAVGPTAVVRIK